MQESQTRFDPYGLYPDIYDGLKRTEKFHYETAEKEHIFITEIYTQDGMQDYYIYTTFDVVYRVVHGSYSSHASDLMNIMITIQ